MQLQRLGFVEQIRFVGDPGGRRVKVPIRHRMQATLPRRSYDHRIREAICEMIEAFWRSLKDSWLYLHGLETETELRRLIAFYVEVHNEVMPHSAFEGQTPNEVFFGTGDAIVAKLAAERVQAQTERMVRNRSTG